MSFKDRLGKYTNKPMYPIPGDIYVAPYGSDENDGSLDHPFATLDRAAQAVRTMPRDRGCITVCLRAGEYSVPCFRLTEEDSGSETCPVVYRAYGDGEVILNGGVTLNPADFGPVSADVRERLQPEARDHVLQVDLKRYGLTKEDWGRICPIGRFNTENKYDDYTPDTNCELFVNGSRMILARYPNNEYAQLGGVAEIGDVWEYPEQNYFLDWNERRNHFGGRYMMDKETALHLANWKSLSDVWVFGYFYHDWADSSTPIDHFDLEHRAFFPKFVSRYGAKKGANYYFYNVLDELDAPGEWYLDRETGMLYLYLPEGVSDPYQARIEMTITRKSIIRAENVHHVIFEDMTLKGTRADALTLTGCDNTVRRIKVYGVLGNAIVVEGYRNLVTECDISHTGKGGIVLSGGYRENLTPGLNVADNNLIHDYAEIFRTYFPGVHLEGVGNVCSHNEIYNAPHAAIFYYGNDHTVEYNYVHEVVLYSSDAGAIYSGQDWAGYGCVIRYNVLENVGSGSYRPDGIYFDDMLSGQTAYGNLLINVVKFGFQMGGGRDLKVFNNIIVNSIRGLSYDDRGRDGLLHGGWAAPGVNDYEKSNMWVRLRQVPYQSPLWAERYPLLAKLSHDFSDMDNPDFAPNPSYSHIHDNLVINAEGLGPRWLGEVGRFSLIERNCVYNGFEHAGITDDYYLAPGCQAANDMPTFQNIPFEQIGRY